MLNQNIVIVPLAGLQQLLGREGNVTLFQIRLKRPFDSDRVAAVQSRLASAAGDFQVSSTSEFSSNLRYFRLTRAIASTVSAIILVTAVLAIANTMLMAVNERTFELGILASVGWRPSRILGLILIEGSAISAIGGIVGLGLGIVTMHVISWTRLSAGLLEPYLTAGPGGPGPDRGAPRRPDRRPLPRLSRHPPPPRRRAPPELTGRAGVLARLFGL